MAKIFRLLKPGGYLYIGIETRYGWGAWLGARDHSGLAFTSVMPRWLADRYCRLRKVPFYGSEISTEGYRTYTYTPSQYEAMVRGAGFQTVEVLGCFDGYNHQIALYSLQDRHARNESLRVAAPASSRAGRIRRWVTDSRGFYKILENEVVLLGCKQARRGRLFWSGLQSPGAITQINTGTKINALLFEGRSGQYRCHFGPGSGAQLRTFAAGRAKAGRRSSIVFGALGQAARPPEDQSTRLL